MAVHVLHPLSLREVRPVPPAAARVPTVRLGRWWAWVALARRTAEGRRALAAMDDRMLADLGLGRAEALREASRAPWDLGPPPGGPRRR